MSGRPGMSEQRVARMKRWRGLVLELVYDGHMKQESRLDDATLLGMMRDLGQSEVGLNQVRTVVQQLTSDGMLKCRQRVNDLTGENEIDEIEILGPGRGLVEKMQKDDSILIL